MNNLRIQEQRQSAAGFGRSWISLGEGLMRYAEHLEKLGGAEYRDKVLANCEEEDVSGRSKPASSGRIKPSHFEVR